jgi:hypothetical protein
MRLLTAWLFAGLVPLSAQTAGKAEAVAVLQRFFDALAAHDGDAIRALMLPDARISVARAAGEPTSTSAGETATRIGADKNVLLERFTAPPSVSVRGRIAQVWGEYEFHRNGAFSHCGVDVATLLMTGGGWKIASLAYTVETAGCSTAR